MAENKKVTVKEEQVAKEETKKKTKKQKETKDDGETKKTVKEKNREERAMHREEERAIQNGDTPENLLGSLKYYFVRLKFTTDFLGTQAADKNVYSSFQYKKALEDGYIEVNDLQEELDLQKFSEEISKAGRTIFPKDAETGALFIQSQMITGFLKDKATTLTSTGVSSLKNPKSKLTRSVFVNPKQIFIKRDGDFIYKADEIYERPLLGSTPQGKITTLVASDQINKNSYIEFFIFSLDPESKVAKARDTERVSRYYLAELLTMGNLHGLGQNRNGGYGKFKVDCFVEALEEDLPETLRIIRPEIISVEDRNGKTFAELIAYDKNK